MARSRGAGALLLAGTILSACSSGTPEAVDPPRSLGDARFYVDPGGNAVQAVERLRSQGRNERARIVNRRIASRPTATWVTTDSATVFAQSRSIASAAEASGTLPVMVAYNIPSRDCGLYSSGGAVDIDAYLDWVGSLAAGIGDHPAVVVLEPDAVPHSLDGCVPSDEADVRHKMLARAIAILRRQPQVHVYLDAGNASWIEDLDSLAAAMRDSGVEEADGFALNVSNFETTKRSVGYGRKLSERLDGAHFVIDTSRNGAGAPPLEKGSRGDWCNPPGRRLGTLPTTQTADPLVDAFLWVKQPGDSDGDCGRGAPEAGSWWPVYADQLLGMRTP